MMDDLSAVFLVINAHSLSECSVMTDRLSLTHTHTHNHHTQPLECIRGINLDPCESGEVDKSSQENKIISIESYDANLRCTGKNVGVKEASQNLLCSIPKK